MRRVTIRRDGVTTRRLTTRRDQAADGKGSTGRAHPYAPAVPAVLKAAAGLVRHTPYLPCCRAPYSRAAGYPWPPGTSSRAEIYSLAMSAA